MSKFAPHRRGINNPPATSNTVCQKCLGRGHYTYECKSTRPYISRPSRTELLEKPRALAKLRKEGQPSVELPEEFKTKKGTADKILEAKERQRHAEKTTEKEPPKKKIRKSSSDVSSGSSSESDSSSTGSSDSESSDSGSDSESISANDRKRRKPKRHSRSSSDSDRS